MSLKKTLLTVAAVGALTAATAVPAMALENEFHGMYKMKYFVSNLDNGGGGFFAPGTTANPNSINPGEKRVSAMNYFEQRARLIYSAKANDDLKLVIAFEIDSVFGDRSQGAISNAGAVGTGVAFRNSGAAFDTDAVNLETKWVHLDFNVPGIPTNVKVGTQAIKDNLKGILFDVDAAGISTTTKFGDNVKVGLGYFRGYEAINGDAGSANTTVNPKRGVNNADLVTLDTKYNLTKDTALGLSYYGYFDYRDNTRTFFDHTVGLTGDTKIGPLALSGFIAGQAGSMQDRTHLRRDLLYRAFAANLAGKIKAGPGSAKFAALYASGDNGRTSDDNAAAGFGKNDAWQSLNYSVGGVQALTTGTAANTYNESGMMLLNRNAASAGTTTDRSIAYTVNNKNQGLMGLFAGYDANLTPKTYASANLGFAWVANQNANRPINLGTGRRNSSDFLGTEINAEVGHKVYDNLTASVQAAYVFLGDYWNNTATGTVAVNRTEPMNPYTARVVLSYAF